MAKKISTIDLSATVKEILNKYNDHVEEFVEKGLNEVMNTARKDVRAKSPKGHTGKYRGGWQKKITRNGRSGAFKAVVYNGGSHGSLTHLLEKGHRTRNGGFVAGTPHIGPVNDIAQKEIMDYLEFNLGNGGLKFV